MKRQRSQENVSAQPEEEEEKDIMSDPRVLNFSLRSVRVRATTLLHENEHLRSSIDQLRHREAVLCSYVTLQEFIQKQTMLNMKQLIQTHTNTQTQLTEKETVHTLNEQTIKQILDQIVFAKEKEKEKDTTSPPLSKQLYSILQSVQSNPSLHSLLALSRKQVDASSTPVSSSETTAMSDASSESKHPSSTPTSELDPLWTSDSAQLNDIQLLSLSQKEQLQKELAGLAQASKAFVPIHLLNLEPFQLPKEFQTSLEKYGQQLVEYTQILAQKAQVSSIATNNTASSDTTSSTSTSSSSSSTSSTSSSSSLSSSPSSSHASLTQSISANTCFLLSLRLFDALRCLEEQQLKADIAHRRSERLLKECKDTKSKLIKLEQELKVAHTNSASLATPSPSAGLDADQLHATLPLNAQNSTGNTSGLPNSSIPGSHPTLSSSSSITSEMDTRPPYSDSELGITNNSSNSDEVSQLKRTIRDLKTTHIIQTNQITDLTNMKGFLMSEVAKLKADKIDDQTIRTSTVYMNLEREVKQLQGVINDRNFWLEKLRTELNEERALYKKYEEEYTSTLQQYKAQAQTQQEQLQTQINKLLQQLTTVKGENAHLKQENTKFKSDLALLKKHDVEKATLTAQINANISSTTSNLLLQLELIPHYKNTIHELTARVTQLSQELEARKLLSEVKQDPNDEKSKELKEWAILYRKFKRNEEKLIKREAELLAYIQKLKSKGDSKETDTAQISLAPTSSTSSTVKSENATDTDMSTDPTLSPSLSAIGSSTSLHASLLDEIDSLSQHTDELTHSLSMQRTIMSNHERIMERLEIERQKEKKAFEVEVERKEKEKEKYDLLQKKLVLLEKLTTDLTEQQKQSKLEASKLQELASLYDRQLEALRHDQQNKSNQLVNTQSLLAQSQSQEKKLKEIVEKDVQSKVVILESKIRSLEEKNALLKDRASKASSTLSSSSSSSGSLSKSLLEQSYIMEITELKEKLRCSVCKERNKSHMIAKCCHVFCKECIDKNIETRLRKCPGCGTKFGVDDIKPVYA